MWKILSILMYVRAVDSFGFRRVGGCRIVGCLRADQVARERQIEHQLGAYTDCNHGQGLAVIQPVYYRHIWKDAPEKFERFAEVVFGADGAEAGLVALEQFIGACGLPTKLSQLASKTEITPELLRQVADSTNIIKSNPRTLTHAEIYKILIECK